MKPEVQRSLIPEARSTVQVNKGAKILTNLFHQLSLSRAQTVSTLSILAKNTTENIPPNQFLFKESFGREFKKTNTLAKSTKNLVRTPLTVSRKVQQPIKPQLQVVPLSSLRGNSRVPATKVSATRRSGASSSNRRTQYRHILLEETLTEEQVDIADRLALFLPKWKEITTD